MFLLVSNSDLYISGCISSGVFIVVSISSSNFFNSFDSIFLYTFFADVPLSECEYLANENTSQIQFLPHAIIHSVCFFQPNSQENSFLQVTHLYLNSSMFIFIRLFCWRAWVTSTQPSRLFLMMPYRW
jgi:hypothetical protein